MLNNNSFSISNRLFWSLIALFTIFYVRVLFIVIYGIDASIYASISAEMIETNNWLQIFHKGNDYLDKPPLHFWLSATFFKVFGVNTFAYKLPSFLFTILGTYSTYRLGKLLYSSDIGKLSALMFYSCFSVILINQDVRTDTILVGIVVFSIWNLVAYLKTNNSWNFVFGFIGIGLAMLAKGPIGLMVPVLALGIHFMIKGEWKNIFKWQWLIGLGITAIVISPMLWGLYHQFDLQPSKEFHLSSGIQGKGTSGLKFYFWDQSFGRITGDNKEWKNNASSLFFTHTFLWSFLPWSFLGVVGLFSKFFNSIKSIKNHEFYTLGAIILPFIAMSMSQFQLPHYIYVFFPLWFIITGWYISRINNNGAWLMFLIIFHHFINLCFILLSIAVCVFIFPTSSVLIWGGLILLIGLLVYFIISTRKKEHLISTTAIAFSTVMFVFAFHFMPSILKYDAPSNAAIKSIELNPNRIFSNDASSLAFDVYSNNTIEYKDINKLNEFANNNNYIFVKDDYLDLIKNTYKTKAVYEFDYHAPTQITANFLNPKTRKSTISTYYLIEF